jgi:hypothetical protein
MIKINKMIQVNFRIVTDDDCLVVSPNGVRIEYGKDFTMVRNNKKELQRDLKAFLKGLVVEPLTPRSLKGDAKAEEMRKVLKVAIRAVGMGVLTFNKGGNLSVKFKQIVESDTLIIL